MESSLGRLLRDRGKVSQLGECVLTYQEADSTNDLALMLAGRGAPHGCLVIAETQSAGRGRWQRQWSSSAGGLYLTALLRPPDDKKPSITLLPAAASVAATEAISEATGVSPRIRWPNDLLVDKHKVGGILCEASFAGARPDFVVAGFGINVNQAREDFPEELATVATSLRIWTGSPQERLLVAACLAERLEHWWEKCLEGSSDILRRWGELAWGETGMRVRVRHKEGEEFEATTSGMAEDGGLRVRLADGRLQTLYSEEVIFFRNLDP
jgi:BirA family biotin operon repressor/biotin-[acetyl-CoA-carboxylase] ligase